MSVTDLLDAALGVIGLARASKERAQAKRERALVHLVAMRTRERNEAVAEAKRMRDIGMRNDDEVCQILGKALNYPWFKDDQKNFPGATAAEGVCVGEHVAATIAHEAALEIVRLRGQVGRLERFFKPIEKESDA